MFTLTLPHLDAPVYLCLKKHQELPGVGSVFKMSGLEVTCRGTLGLVSHKSGSWHACRKRKAGG